MDRGSFDQHLIELCISSDKRKSIIQEMERIFRREKMLQTRSAKIDLLEAYSKFLEKEGYMDTDWWSEEPFAIDEFLKEPKKKKILVIGNEGLGARLAREMDVTKEQPKEKCFCPSPSNGDYSACCRMHMISENIIECMGNCKEEITINHDGNFGISPIQTFLIKEQSEQKECIHEWRKGYHAILICIKCGEKTDPLK